MIVLCLTLQWHEEWPQQQHKPLTTQKCSYFWIFCGLESQQLALHLLRSSFAISSCCCWHQLPLPPALVYGRSFTSLLLTNTNDSHRLATCLTWSKARCYFSSLSKLLIFFDIMISMFNQLPATEVCIHQYVPMIKERFLLIHLCENIIEKGQNLPHQWLLKHFFK